MTAKEERMATLLREARLLLADQHKIDPNHAWFKCVEQEVNMPHEGIQVHKGSVALHGGCNFCRQYPPKFAQVWVLRGNSLEARICADCLMILKEVTK